MNDKSLLDIGLDCLINVLVVLENKDISSISQLNKQFLFLMQNSTVISRIASENRAYDLNLQKYLNPLTSLVFYFNNLFILKREES